MSHDAAERLVAGRWTLHTALRRGPAGADQAALWARVAAEARAAASLDQLIARDGPLPVGRVAGMGLDLPAALLEFTYQDGETWHSLELGIRSPRHHIAMAIYSRDRDWGAGWALFEAFKGSFVPPSA
jgi:hypothetical protein